MTETIDFVDVYEFLLKNDIEHPVTILKHGQPHAVMVPYEIFSIIQKNSKKAIHVSELTDEDLSAILNAEIPDACREFDGEVKK